ncbi:hypothetical protein NG99_02695, partial [Erwinia typographi]
MSNYKTRHHNIISRKNLIAVAILMAFGGHDAIASPDKTVHASDELQSCPAAEKFEMLSSEEKEKLPAECQKETSLMNNKMVLGGGAAAVVGIGALMAGGSSSGGGSSDNSNNNDNKGNNENNGSNDTAENKPIIIDGKNVPGQGEISNTISGNDQQVTIKGETIAAGEGTIGTLITGDGATANVTGNTTVSDGGKGMVVEGNNSTVDVGGTINATGTGSIALEVNGDRSDVRQNGDMLVAGGATGFKVSGESNKVSNNGSISVQDASSVGLDITGNNAVFSNAGNIYAKDYGTGVQISGNNILANLDGSVVADAGDNKVSAKGVVLHSSNSTVKITGDVTVKSDKLKAIPEYLTVTGVSVNGDHNKLDISGAVNIQQNTNDRGSHGKGILGGVIVLGNKNIINVLGGINVDATFGDDGANNERIAAHIEGMTVNGHDNYIFLSGRSNFRSASFGYQGHSHLVDINGKNNELVLSKDFVLDIDVIPSLHELNQGVDFFNTSSGTILANGDVSGSLLGFLFSADSSGKVINNGAVDVNLTSSTGALTVIAALDSTGHNTAEGTLAVKSSASYVAARWSSNVYPFGNGAGTATAMIAGGSEGLIINDGTLDVAGASTYGMFVRDGATAINNGTIIADAMQLHVDDKGNFNDVKSLTFSSESKYRGAAMFGRAGTSLLNTGNIVINNAGTGMQVEGAMAINRGRITLNADHSDADKMYAMRATDGGILINDATGVININTDKGYAFYADDGSYVYNLGTINHNGTPIDESDPAFGTESPDDWGANYARLDSLSASGESSTLSTDKKDGFYALMSLVNRGNLALDSSLLAYDRLTNHGNITVNDKAALTIKGRLTNHGSVTLNASGPLTVNSGDNYGEISGSSTSGLIKTSGAFYNREGAVIRNTDSEAAGTSLIHSTLTEHGNFIFYNAGKILASAGANAIWTRSHDAQGSRDVARSVFNDTTGIIRGEGLSGNTLIELGRSYSLYNKGEITINGKNTSAIRTVNTAFSSEVLNSGVINLGTKEGRAAGTNGTGLIAVKVQNDATVVNNADGVINIWADDSWAFSSPLSTRNPVFINNGIIDATNCNNCGIFSPDSKVSALADGADSWRQPSVPEPVVAGVVTNYVIGTNGDGTAGKYAGKDIVIGKNVLVSTGFTDGTADKAVTFSNVFQGSNISGEQNIASSSVVWNASASKNAEGNVDVTMIKNDYADVVTDSSVNGLAAALDKSYTSNKLFNSLNVSTASSLNKALKQLSGKQAKSLDREKRVLSQRFTMLAENAPVTTENGLSFNVVAKGDRRAEMDNKVTYDMMAVQQDFNAGAGKLSASYGIARLSGKGGNAG